MKSSTSWLALTAATFLAGCNTVERQAGYDLSSNGGFVGHYADEVMPANNKEMELYRATFVFTLLSKTGADTLQDPDEIVNFDNYMHLVKADLDRAQNHLLSPDCKTALTNADGADCRQLFEADLPRLELHMMRLASLALPQKTFQSVISDFVTGSYLNGALGLARVAGTILYTGHDDAATVRTNVELMQLIDGASNTGAPYDFAKTASAISDAKPDPWAYRAMYNQVLSSCHDLQSHVPEIYSTKIRCDFKYQTTFVKNPPYYGVDTH